LDGRQYTPDALYNLSPAVRRLLDRRILQEASNPLNLLKRRIVDYVHQTYRKPGNRSPLFTICESEPRVVSTFQNFDSLLTPEDHVSRRPSDTYYVNRENCLRAHTSAHQHTLMKQGLDAFLVIGDVYRRDEVDKTHYPCFHQIEGVRLYSKEDLLGKKPVAEDPVAELFSSSPDPSRLPEKQETHSLDAVKATEIQLKHFLEALCDELFGKETEKRWVDAYFPFTHPSYELEIFYNGQWLEVLGCGIMEQKLLESAGVTDKIGWAFGIGLERIAMVLYSIPDIRLFWSTDTGFLSQFAGKLPGEDVKYKQISSHPQVIFDISFFLPSSTEFNDMTSDVYDTIRTIGGELVEQVKLTDEFENKKKGKKSQTYRIVYRSHEKALTKEETQHYVDLFLGLSPLKYRISRMRVIIAVLSLATVANSLYFHIAETEKKCFIEEIPDETMVTGNYKVQLYDPNTKGYGDYPNIGMHVEVKDPEDKVILSKLYTAEGRFTFTSNTPGEHVICIYSNSTAWFNGAQLRVHLDIQAGDHAQDYAQIAQKDKLNELQLRIRQLLDQVDQITKEQNYQRYREERFRQTSESTNSRVFYWSIAQVVVLAITGAWQMRHLRGFFEAKKLV
uniref:phenylalanine--tRNA ligase n=1 Tax=Caenorhabditis tropicalis TaxID=1561998 RepID=A0A1I7UJN8_9PELO